MSEDKAPNKPAESSPPLAPTLPMPPTVSAQNTTISDFMNRFGLKGGVALAAPQDLLGVKAQTRDSKGRYDIGGVVGSGGMGTVLKAKDINLRRWVAMKVAQQPGRDLQVQVLRFIEEAQVTGQLDHPNIVPVYELGVDASDSVFYTMKLVSGTTLHQILNELRDGNPETITRYPLARLLGIFLKACDAMAFAHSKGVIHRDLKPQNIMVGGYGEVLVLDWGLAKVLTRNEGKVSRVEGQGSGEEEAPAIKSRRAGSANDAHHTMDGQVMGTPTFMAPEQAEGRIGELEAWTDIYALGAILYNILALRPPVEGVTVKEILAKVTSGQIIPPTALGTQGSRVEGRGEGNAGKGTSVKGQAGPEPRALNPSPFFPHCLDGRIPEALSAVAMKALAFKPEDRYPDVKELQADVERYQAGFATLAENAGLGRQLSLLVRRHKGLVSAAALVFVSILVGLIVSLAQWRRAESARRIAETNERRADQNEKQAVEAKTEAEKRRDQAEYLSYRALLGLAQGDLDKGDETSARRELTACPKRFRHWEWGFLSRQCRLIEESTDKALSWVQVAMSVDGKRVAWPTVEGIVVKPVSGGNGQVIRSTTLLRTLIQFTPDATSLVVLRYANNSTHGILELCSIDTGASLWQTKVPGGNIPRLVAAPVEPYAVAGGCGAPNPPFAPFSLVDLRTGEIVGTLGQADTPLGAAVWTPDGACVWWASGNALHLYDMQTGIEAKRLTGHAAYVLALAVTPDGQRIASAGGDGNVRVWDAVSGAQVATFWCNASVSALLFVAGGKYLLGGATDGTLCAWDPANGRVIGMTHGPGVASLAGTSKSEPFYIGQTNHSVRRAFLGQVTGQGLLAGESFLGCVAFSRHSDTLLYGSAEKFVLFTPDAMSVSRIVNHSNYPLIWNLAWDGDETAPVATAYANGDVRVWDLQEGKLLHEFTGDRHATGAAVVCWIEPGKLLAAGGQTATEVSIYDIGTGKLVRRLDTEVKIVRALALSPDRKILYVGGGKGLTAFDVATWQPVSLALSPAPGPTGAIAFSPDGQWLAVSSSKGTQLWRKDKNERHACIDGVFGNWLAFSPDGKRLAVPTGTGGAITLIDPERGVPLLTLTDHPYGYMRGLAFSPDSRRLASAARSLLSREADPWEE